MYYLNTNAPMILFGEVRNSEIYVDKSKLIEQISKRIKTGNKYVCITRPRRFGKTINANMLRLIIQKDMTAQNCFVAWQLVRQENIKSI